MTSERGMEDRSFVMGRGGPLAGTMKENDGGAWSASLEALLRWREICRS